MKHGVCCPIFIVKNDLVKKFVFQFFLRLFEKINQKYFFPNRVPDFII